MSKTMTAVPFDWERFGDDMRKSFPSEGLCAAAAAVGLPHQAIIRAKQGVAVSVPTFLALCRAMRKDPFKYADTKTKMDDR